MTRTRSLSSYSPLFWDIIDRVAVKKERFDFSLPDQRAAMKLQGKFYAFRGSLKRELDRVRERPEGLTAREIETIEQTYTLSCAVVFWRDREDIAPVRVSFMHRDLTEENQILAAMLARSPSASDPTGEGQRIADSESRLKELLGEQPPAGKKNPYY